MKKNLQLHILVLSNGGYDGLGKERTAEMAAAATHMGFTTFKVIDDKRVPDGPHPWNIEAVGEITVDHMKSLADNGQAIETVITFDEQGVSSHPNHISCYEACLKLKKDNKIKRLLKLESVNILRKFSAWLDIFTADASRLRFVLPSPLPAASALQKHWTQWVWFRKLFISFSRYAYFNELIDC